MAEKDNWYLITSRYSLVAHSCVRRTPAAGFELCRRHHAGDFERKVAARRRL
jgi:hypothetical protein